ncbi:MAG: hypothetical protein ACREDE_10410, partial [Thermoplasmata archaeon]
MGDPLRIRDALDPASRAAVRRARWFAQKSHRLRRLEVDDLLPLGGPPDRPSLVIVRAEVADGLAHFYAVPSAALPARRTVAGGRPAARLTGTGGRGVAVGELPTLSVARRLLGLIADGAARRGERGLLRGVPFSRAAVRLARSRSFPIRPMGVEQSHTSLAIGPASVLKIFRELSRGDNPDVSIPRYLGAGRARPLVPAPLGMVVYERRGWPTTVIASLNRFVPNEGDAFGWFVARLRRAGTRPPPLRREVTNLARDVADLHLALARGPADPRFAPAPVRSSDVRRWEDHARGELETLLE